MSCSTHKLENALCLQSQYILYNTLSTISSEVKVMFRNNREVNF